MDQALDFFWQGVQANTTNDSLNGNVRWMIERVQQLTLGEGSPQPAAEEAVTSHVLLDAYRLH